MFTTYSYYIVFGMSLGFPSFLAGILSAPDFMDLSLSLARAVPAAAEWLRLAFTPAGRLPLRQRSSLRKVKMCCSWRFQRAKLATSSCWVCSLFVRLLSCWILLAQFWHSTDRNKNMRCHMLHGMRQVPCQIIPVGIRDLLILLEQWNYGPPSLKNQPPAELEPVQLVYQRPLLNFSCLRGTR